MESKKLNVKSKSSGSQAKQASLFIKKARAVTLKNRID
jgi:hypothetical protein